ncbi:MAG: ABC-ATPase domain-containing protein [Thermodesulfobacteriota bacterium]
MERLIETLRQIDRKGYKAYKELQGKEYKFPFYTLFMDHVQGDPFATSSRLRVLIPQSEAGFPDDTFSNTSREVALRDFLVRTFAREAKKHSRQCGTGKSGQIFVDPPSQEILERSAAHVSKDYVELRLFVGLPASGRWILGREAEEMLTIRLPALVERTLLKKNLDSGVLYEHVETSEDADALRGKLSSLDLTAFVADGSMLPRRSGVDDRPMKDGLPFRSPESLRVEVELPNRGRITGMGIPRGVSLIVGGGFHGKSTLLRAFERGVFNHIPGDGREFVVSDPTAVKIRAEDGRSVVGVDISPFIGGLPGGVDTEFFKTQNASGSTSQAANILEALEAGSTLLLLDEDTSATNFMIRDRRMQALVEKKHEPITPFVDKVNQLYEDHGVSTVLVMGGAGDYFDVADKVIAMVEYEPEDLTGRAEEIAADNPTGRATEGGEAFGALHGRVPVPESLDSRKGRHESHLKARGLKTLTFGREDIDLAFVEQLVEDGQVKAIGYAMVYARERYMDGGMDIREVITAVDKDLGEKGLDIVSPTIKHPSDLVGFRPQELAAAINRLRSLRIKKVS